MALEILSPTSWINTYQESLISFPLTLLFSKIWNKSKLKHTQMLCWEIHINWPTIRYFLLWGKDLETCPKRSLRSFQVLRSMTLRLMLKLGDKDFILNYWFQATWTKELLYQSQRTSRKWWKNTHQLWEEKKYHPSDPFFFPWTSFQSFRKHYTQNKRPTAQLLFTSSMRHSKSGQRCFKIWLKHSSRSQPSII